ncbi:hypothetical protein JCM17844_25410 [Iodidimonas gelatinilytica]|uniref:Cation-transporting P-type ATPase N-terminal domain-containing protein n=1 Tax=Iodidimonas gelatinilytica TaxID=1236966 RepID=A0A5A7N0Q5_9PROT|nr:cation-transporting P-type ATPase [Iodidimonas gelatinilytica]GEQ98904.1 hypothetical protein JCM17844_25410 [Iodidimonas gelatinilytica]GER01698.1 hypothetical protein JCM17845_23210 [Iodidimonas gelatinilytica]
MSRAKKNTTTAAPQPWHSMAPSTVLERFKSNLHGLTDQEAAERYQKNGPNRLPAYKRRGPAIRLFLQFHNLLIYVLIGAALLSLALGHGIDALVIAAVVLLNA